MEKRFPSSDMRPDGTFEHLIALLKLGAFVNSPMRDGVCEPHGVSHTEAKVLMALVGEGERAGHDLVEIIGASPMNVSRAIMALKDRGWIEDGVDNDNRRRKPVRLTAAGRAAYQSMLPAMQGVADALFGGLTVRQRQQFAALSEKLLDAMIAWIRTHHAEVKIHGRRQIDL